MAYVRSSHVPFSRNRDRGPGPPAAGPYSHAVKSNGMLFVSGQVHLDPATGQLDRRHARPRRPSAASRT